MSRIKFFLSITLVLLATIPTTILFSPTANAWAPTATPPALTSDLPTKLDETFAGTRYENWREQDWATANYDGSTFLFVIRDDGISPVGDAGAGQSVLNGSVCRWNYDLTWPGCNPFTQNQGLASDTIYQIHFSQALIDSNTPAYQALVAQYPTMVEGEPPFPNDVSPRCEPWDIVCWFESTTGSIVDGFQSLADFFGNTIKGLGEWIANLIMPSNEDGSFDNRFTEFFTTVQDTMTQRLGFLLFPFEFIADLFASFSSIWNPGGTEGCTSGSVLSVPNLLGENAVTFDLCAIEDTPIWTPAVTVLRFVWIVGVVGFLHKKYFSVVRG